MTGAELAQADDAGRLEAILEATPTTELVDALRRAILAGERRAAYVLRSHLEANLGADMVAELVRNATTARLELEDAAWSCAGEW